MEYLKKAWGFLSGEPLSRVAQVCAVVIAGIWAWHTHLITSEDEIRPEVNVCVQAVGNKNAKGYSNNSRLVVIYIPEKNVGKVPIELDSKALVVTIKKIPESRLSGFVNVDEQPVAYENKDFLKRYGDEGTVIDSGVEYTEVELLNLPFGIYRAEAEVTLKDEDFANGMAVFDVTADMRADSHCTTH